MHPLVATVIGLVLLGLLVLISYAHHAARNDPAKAAFHVLAPFGAFLVGAVCFVLYRLVG